MTPWHAPPDTIERFARTPEALDDTTAASVEQHLVTCAACRARLAAATDPVTLERSWADVADVVDRPPARFAERLLGRLGVSARLARVVGATAGLRFAWLVTVSVVAGMAGLVAQQGGSDAAFLVVAPLVPIGSVLLTFLATEDPAGEAGTATPMHGAGLVLARALTVVIPTFLILGLASLAQPDLARAALWVLPGIALTLGALALATVMRPTTATAGLSLTWLLTVLAVAKVTSGHLDLMDLTAIFGPTGQVMSLVLALGAAAMLYTRRDRFSTLEVLL